MIVVVIWRMVWGGLGLVGDLDVGFDFGLLIVWLVVIGGMELVVLMDLIWLIGLCIWIGLFGLIDLMFMKGVLFGFVI